MKNFKLNALEAKELKNVKGGYVWKQVCEGGANTYCGCACAYANRQTV